jgi:glutamate-1-semialdehyde 2,1-aminomutase
MFTWFFQNGPVFDWETAAKSDTQAFAGFHRKMLDSGFYFPPSQYEALFVSAAHSEEDIEKTVEAAEKCFV